MIRNLGYDEYSKLQYSTYLGQDEKVFKTRWDFRTRWIRDLGQDEQSIFY